MDKLVLTHLTKVISRHLDSISAHYRVEDIELCLISCPADITALSLVQTYLYLGVEANVFGANYKSISSENKSFIAHIKKNDEDCFVYVQSASENLVIYYEGNDRKESTPVDFQAIWTGIVIIANKTEQNEEYHLHNKPNKYTPRIILLCIVLILCGLRVSIIGICTTILDVLGSILCIGIIKTQFPRHTLFDKFCIANSRFDCQKLDLGRYISILSKKNLAVIGLAYFATRIFISIISWEDPSSIAYATDIVSLCVSAIAICSIIYQVVIRQFCLLCISVMGILITEGVMCYYNYNDAIQLSYNNWVTIVISLIFGVAFSWITENNLKSQYELFSMRIKELKIKRNLGIIKHSFDSTASAKDFHESFSIGNANAPITITTYISPWCSKCKKVALQMIRLISWYPKYINWRIYLDNINVEQFEIVNKVQLSLGRCITSNMTEKDKLETLKNWYKKRSERKLLAKSNTLESDIQQVKEMLIKQTDVVKGEKGVPSIWINGNVFPENYSLDDIPYILLELCMIHSQKH